MDVCAWKEARERAGSFPRRLDSLTAAPDEAVGSVLAEPLRALADMPAYDTSMHDGWAVCGPGPWHVRKANRRDMFAGLEYHESSTHRLLRDGQATPVMSGEPLGDGVTGVVSLGRARVDGDLLKLGDTGRPSNYIEPGSGVRARGTDAGLGTVLLPAGDRVTPAVAALSAAAGHDTIPIIPMPSVGLIRVGAEILDSGIPRSGFARDSVSPALPGWIAGMRTRVQPARWVTQGDGELIDVIDDIVSDIVVTAGPFCDAAVRRVLQGMKADVLVAGVHCKPGGSMLLAQLQDGRPLIHCGGVPADAIATLVTLLAPIVAALTCQPNPTEHLRLEDAVVGDRLLTHLLPVRPTNDRGSGVSYIRTGGPGGLFALSQATGLAVIPTSGIRPNEQVKVLPLP